MHRHQHLVRSEFQTKTWRRTQSWYINGKHGECEQYQRKQLDELFSLYSDHTLCINTKYRFNMYTLEFKHIPHPLKYVHGFNWTEDFDGYIEHYNMFINLKFICGDGGAQTRSLREVAHFIHTQIRYLHHNPGTKYTFVNILDGDTCWTHMSKFKYFMEREPIHITSKIFIGDMVEFVNWFTIKLSIRE